MENKSQQHVQLPNNMTASGELTPKDLLIYILRVEKYITIRLMVYEILSSHDE
jgi:hypothetical protein